MPSPNGAWKRWGHAVWARATGDLENSGLRNALNDLVMHRNVSRTVFMARRVPFFSFLENVRFLHYYGEDSIINIRTVSLH